MVPCLCCRVATVDLKNLTKYPSIHSSIHQPTCFLLRFHVNLFFFFLPTESRPPTGRANEGHRPNRPSRFSVASFFLVPFTKFISTHRCCQWPKTDQKTLEKRLIVLPRKRMIPRPLGSHTKVKLLNGPRTVTFFFSQVAHFS